MQSIIGIVPILSLHLCVHICSAQGPVAYTKNATIRGRTNTYNGKVVNEFLGVPYGAPPVGELRFKRPLPAQPSEEIDATRYGPACYQFTHNPYPWYDNLTYYDEDCLNLNIWVPSSTRNGTEVFYWIFSGGLTYGSNRLPVYHGGPLAAIGDIIVVTINYRVGSFGFFFSGTEDAPGNMGFYDALLGLKWVRDNIDAFGGDPNKITIGGQSAGSIASSYFLVSPLTTGLFKRAILMSGTFLVLQDGRAPNLELGQRFAERLGCADEVKSLITFPDEVVSCLRRRNASDLAHVLSELEPHSTRSFLPVYGDPIVDFTPETALEAGHFHEADVLMGNTEDEIVYEMTTGHPEVFGFFGLKDTLFNKSYARQLMDEDVFKSVVDKEEATSFYLDKVDDDDLQGIRQQTILGYADFSTVCPSLYFGEAISRRNNVYYYLVKRRPSVTNWAYWMGVVHFDDVQYVFGLPTLYPGSYTPDEESFSVDIMTLWSNFIKNGNPGEEWPRFTEETRVTRILRDAGHRIDEPGPHLQACDYLKRFFIQSRAVPS